MDKTLFITDADIIAKGTINPDKINDIVTALKDKAVKLSLVFDHCESLKKLPIDFRKFGKFNNVEFIGCTSLKSLATKMNIDRTLKIKGCPLITKLPKTLKAKDSVIVDNCANFKTLPSYLHLSGSLKVSDCPSFTGMPSTLFVKYDVDVTKCESLKNLGASMHVGRNLSAAFCEKLKLLPKNMKVGGHIDLRGASALQSFPGGIKIHADLNLSGCTALRKLPKDLQVRGTLRLSNCDSLTELPHNTHIGRDLIVTDNIKLKQLPQNLTVGGDLDISRCHQIEEYPEGIKVGYGVNLSHNARLAILPKHWVVNSTLNLSDCPALEVVPSGLRVKGDLNLKECQNLKELGSELEIIGDLLMYNCRSITQLPSDLIATGKWLLEKCQSLTHFPEDRVIGGNLILKDCASLIYLPQPSFIGGLLDLTGCNKLGTDNNIQSLEQLIGILDEMSNNDVSIWYPSHILDRSEGGQLLAKLADLFPESLGNDKEVIPLYKFLKQFMSQNLQNRGGKKFVVAQVNELIDYLKQSDNYLVHIAWMNQLAEQYLEHCVNQRVNGFMGIMAWLTIAKAPDISQKLTAASYLCAFEQANRYVGGGLGYDNRYEETHFNGNEVHAEAANLMMIRAKERLIKEGLLQTEDWPGVPISIAFAETVQGWVDQHFELFYKSLKTNLFNNDITKTLILDMATQNLQNIQVWGRIAYPKLVHTIEAEYHPEAIKTKKEALQYLTAMDSTWITRYLESTSRAGAINELVEQINDDSKKLSYEIKQYLKQSALQNSNTDADFQKALATMYQQLELDDGVEQKIAKAVRQQTELDIPSTSVGQTTLVALNNNEPNQTVSLV